MAAVTSDKTAEELDGVKFSSQLNDALKVFFGDIVKAAITDPTQGLFLLKTLSRQRAAAAKRLKLEREGTHVPPILIISITNTCNLSCTGCFNSVLRPRSPGEMSIEKIRGIIKEAADLGVSFVVISGGEPLTRPDILDVARDFPQMMFVIFTNGTLMDEAMAKRIRGVKNMIPLVSLEGNRLETDGRRGVGVYEQLKGAFAALRREGVFFGASITVTRTNFPTVMDGGFVGGLVANGCRLFIHVEYTPVVPGTEDLVVTPEQREVALKVRASLRLRHRAVFLILPHDEEDVGGCLAAGRGFVHVNALGGVEPCPFVPVSDTSLIQTTLRDALSSDLLRRIREKHFDMRETSGGCTLWKEGQLVAD